MKASALIRTGSGSHLVPASPTLSHSRRNSFSGHAPSLHFDRKPNAIPKKTIRRALSDSHVFQPTSRLSSAGSLNFPLTIPEEDYLDGLDDDIGQSGGGSGKGKKSGDDDRSKIGDYYREMLKSSPGDPLLLRNYGKYLHEVEKDTVGAEEYYGRAILASPGDGEVLSLYGKLIWETHRVGDRAKAYFDRALHLSPNDCAVLGSYAEFMWEAGDPEEEETNVSTVAHSF